MQTKLAIPLPTPELEIEDSFYNKACVYEQNMKIASFTQIDQKGIKCGMIYPAEIEFTSSAKGLSIRVVNIDKDSGVPFEIVEKKESKINGLHVCRTV